MYKLELLSVNLGFGIAGTAIALLSGGMGLFGLNRNAGSCNNGCTLTCEDKVELAGAIYQGRINITIMLCYLNHGLVVI